MAAFLLCTDLDGTVLGNPEAEAAFRTWKLRMAGRMEVAYITGRGIDDVRALISQGRIPDAEYAATEVGTAVWDLRDPHNHLGRHYQDLADPAWPAQDLRALGNSKETPVQGPEGQGRFKASFFWDGQASSLDAFKRRLKVKPDWRLLVTADHYLDLLPHCYSKGQALRFLAAASGMGLKRCIAAGDMEHDLDMFEAAASGIVPDNALPALKNALKDSPVYISGQTQAWGLLDGLRRLGFE